MEQFYKGRRIEISVWLDGDRWIASLYIYYSEGLQNILVTFAVPDTFKTHDEAIEVGLAAAQRWIDYDTTPALNRHKTLPESAMVHH
jgi:hypothetical protein